MARNDSWLQDVAHIAVRAACGLLVGACILTTCTPLDWKDWDVFSVMPRVVSGFVVDPPPVDHDPDWMD
jgi:hypothetical protein